jgi:hypothetical protein
MSVVMARQDAVSSTNPAPCAVVAQGASREMRQFDPFDKQHDGFKAAIGQEYLVTHFGGNLTGFAKHLPPFLKMKAPKL